MPNNKGLLDKTTDTRREKVPAIRLVASLQKFVQVENFPKPHPLSNSVGAIPYHSFEEGPAPICEDEAPSSLGAFTERIYKGKVIRDVWIDTHDFINEPGGFVINLTRHGHGVSKHIKIHLGIRQKCLRSNDGVNALSLATSTSMGEIVQPGTITATDDYAREIFRGIRAHPELESVSAVLEISDRDDAYEQKVFQESSPEFLKQFIQTYPTSLSKMHVEMPGLSSVYLPEWKFLLEQQTCLKVLICNFGVVLWSFYEKGVIRNSKTLEKIVLRRVQSYDVMSGKYSPMNWNMFANCQKLVYLKVTCGCRCVGSVNPNSATPPSSVFLHENINNLPVHAYFTEFHLSKIWIDPCQLREFYEKRPKIDLCVNCNDMEYYDGDMTAEEAESLYDYFRGGSSKQLQLLSVSRFDLAADISPDTATAYTDEEKRAARHERSRERKLGCIVLALFQAIIVALVILFIIIYFKHLRQSENKGTTPMTGFHTTTEHLHDYTEHEEEHDQHDQHEQHDHHDHEDEEENHIAHRIGGKHGHRKIDI